MFSNRLMTIFRKIYSKIGFKITQVGKVRNKIHLLGSLSNAHYFYSIIIL